MVNLRPQRGAYLRPFGCGQFIVAFLAGHGPDFAARAIDPLVGAPMADVFYEYKEALHRAFAEDMVATEEGKRAKRKRPPLTIEEADRLRTYYMERIPLKFTRARYSSFCRYFDHLKRLGWVERTGKEEPSAIQDDYPEGPPRVYYWLTDTGRAASPMEIMNPLRALYPHFSKEYFQQHRRSKKYYRGSRTRIT